MSQWPRAKFGVSDWALLSRERMADGFFQLDRLTLSHRGYQCDEVGPMSRELFIREPAVVVILFDPKADAVVMVEQFRVGAALSSLDDSPWMLEWVAGICDPGEPPEETARREVLEETGLVIEGAVHPLFTYYPSPGGSTELIHLFWATVDSRLASEFCGQAGEHEDLRVHVIDRAAAIEALMTGQVNNAATIIGLQWLVTHRPDQGDF